MVNVSSSPSINRIVSTYKVSSGPSLIFTEECYLSFIMLLNLPVPEVLEVRLVESLAVPKVKLLPSPSTVVSAICTGQSNILIYGMKLSGFKAYHSADCHILGTAQLSTGDVIRLFRYMDQLLSSSRTIYISLAAADMIKFISESRIIPEGVVSFINLSYG